MSGEFQFIDIGGDPRLYMRNLEIALCIANGETLRASGARYKLSSVRAYQIWYKVLRKIYQHKTGLKWSHWDGERKVLKSEEMKEALMEYMEGYVKWKKE